MQPQSFGAGHLAAVTLLTFVGAFCAVLLSAAYTQQVPQWMVSACRPAGAAAAAAAAHALQHYPACPHLLQGGLLYSVLMPAIGIGLPFLLAVFPVHAYRCAAEAEAAADAA